MAISAAGEVRQHFSTQFEIQRDFPMCTPKEKWEEEKSKEILVLCVTGWAEQQQPGTEPSVTQEDTHRGGWQITHGSNPLR